MSSQPCTKGSFAHSPVAFDPRSDARQNSTLSEEGSMPSSEHSAIVPSIVISLGSDSSVIVSFRSLEQLTLELLPDVPDLLLVRRPVGRCPITAAGTRVQVGLDGALDVEFVLLEPLRRVRRPSESASDGNNIRSRGTGDLAELVRDRLLARLCQ